MHDGWAIVDKETAIQVRFSPAFPGQIRSSMSKVSPSLANVWQIEDTRLSSNITIVFIPSYSNNAIVLYLSNTVENSMAIITCKLSEIWVTSIEEIYKFLIKLNTLWNHILFNDCMICMKLATPIHI